MATAAIQKHPDEYDDMVLRPPCEEDENRWTFRYQCDDDRTWSSLLPTYSYAMTPLKTFVRDDATELVSSDMTSVSFVLDGIKRAPFAYFRFFSITGFLFFTFSLAFYSILGIILFNPVLALFGAFGSLLVGLLVEASLLHRKRSSKMRQRGILA